MTDSVAGIGSCCMQARWLVKVRISIVTVCMGVRMCMCVCVCMRACMHACVHV